MPNAYMLAARKVANHSAHPQSRVSVPVYLGAKESIDKARGGADRIDRGR